MLSLLILLAAFASPLTTAHGGDAHANGQLAAGAEANAALEENSPSGSESQRERPAAKYRAPQRITPQRIGPQRAPLVTTAIARVVATPRPRQPAPARDPVTPPPLASERHDPALGLHRGQAPPSAA